VTIVSPGFVQTNFAESVNNPELRAQIAASMDSFAIPVDAIARAIAFAIEQPATTLLRNAGLRGGDLVAAQGIGGLGHLGVQFARHMGFHTVAVGRGRDRGQSDSRNSPSGEGMEPSWTIGSRPNANSNTGCFDASKQGRG
jgi:threonine dehydrogenase-like Zn-dependent dehydrogenase